MAHDVFISYSTHDVEVATAACAALEARNFSVWIAPRDILPGMMWGEAIIDAINDTRMMIIIYSSHSNRSGQVMREVERAAGKNVPIVPFRIEDVPASKSLEFFLSSPHWLDALDPPIEKHLNTLVRTVRSLLATSSAEGAQLSAGAMAATERLKPEPARSNKAKRSNLRWILLSALVVFSGTIATAWYTGMLAPLLRIAQTAKSNVAPRPREKVPTLVVPVPTTTTRTVSQVVVAPPSPPPGPSQAGVPIVSPAKTTPSPAVSHPKVAAVVLPPPPPKPSKAELNAKEFTRGMDSYKANDFAAAVKIWKPLSDSGYAPAQDALGWCYQNGQGTGTDQRHAATLYRAAADQGDEGGETDLGMAYKLGLGVAQSDTDAFQWFEAAAKSGSPAGEYLLANLYEKGRGVTRSLAEARSWYAKAAAKGYRPAQDRLRELGP